MTIRARPLVSPLVAMLTLVASGCAAVGPDFKSPAPPSVAGYIPAGENVAARSDTSPTALGQTIALGDKVAGDWWTLFQSSELDGLVKQAIAGSPTLERAKARLTEAREGVAEARGAQYPQVSLGADFARAKESAAAFGLSPERFPLPPNYNLFQIGPTASYSLDLFGRVRREIEQRSALADLQSDELDAAYLALTANTVRRAIEVAGVRAQLKAVDNILDIDRQNLDLVRAESRAGQVPDSDVVTAESQLAADETLRPELEQQLSEARHALAVLTGHPPGDWSPPDFDLTALALPGRLPVELPSELVRRRPDIRAAEAQLHAASARIGIADARLYPDITLSAGITASSLDGSNLFSTSSLAWSTAAGLTQPIFDGGLRRSQRRAALADFKAWAADYQQTVLQSFGQVADILQALRHDGDLMDAQQRSLSLSSDSERLQRIAYTKGGAGILSLLDAQRQHEQALLGYVRAQAQRYQDTVQLLAAMGGGWWDANLTVTDNAAALNRDHKARDPTP